MMEEQIKAALDTLRRGGIILYPTDTLWGIGCDATNAEAVERVYALKGKADKRSMLVLVESPDQVARYIGTVPTVAWELYDVSDKPLTLVLPGARGVAENLIPESGTLGIRIPADAFCTGLLRKLKRPLVSTSANRSGESAPVDFEEIDETIRAGVDFVVDPSCEGTPTRRPSSIIAVGPGGEINILRP